MLASITLREHEELCSTSLDLVGCVKSWFETSDKSDFLYSKSWNPVKVRHIETEEKRTVFETKVMKGSLFVKSSYFVGVDWIVPGKLKIEVQPKVEEGKRVDYIKLLSEGLLNPEAEENADDLYAIDWDATPVPCSSENGNFKLFLAILFVGLMKKLLKKGLRRAYYPKEAILSHKIKGKVALSKLQRNISSKAALSLTCKFDEFDFDSPENRLLKEALKLSKRIIQNCKSCSDSGSLLVSEIGRQMKFFDLVTSLSNLKPVKNLKPNPFFKDYGTCLRIANELLFFQSLDRPTDSSANLVPPYWINMPKLFELFVLKELRSRIHYPHWVKYHFCSNYQELDYFGTSQYEEIPFFVADAKYKPNYITSSVEKEDLRQVAGYARFSSVYENLGLSGENKLIPCLIIYTNQSCPEKLELDKISCCKGYEQIYKVGIALPTL
ncbi:hypothetical protein [uncultured Parasutterella sp.]|jgi:5-methylcytosine-specific restriction enzyme subunit McrC|uniref:5-methylcytosine restriction system specificity protein McrC n=1 Tax=uncultured Parasutterella sp. TaxID=1263098 RepID=UPI0025F02507|nr:hypothetical protein [uncultured Parasutterella sp.]